MTVSCTEVADVASAGKVGDALLIGGSTSDAG